MIQRKMKFAIEKELNLNRLLRQAPKRYAQYYKDSKDKLSLNNQLLVK